MTRLDLENQNHKLLVAAIANLVTEEGMNPKEVLEFLEVVGNDLWSALHELSEEEDA